MRKQEFNSKLISLLPLDEVPVHVPLRRPRPLRFERLRVPVWNPYSRSRFSPAKSEDRKGGVTFSTISLTFFQPHAPLNLYHHKASHFQKQCFDFLCFCLQSIGGRLCTELIYQKRDFPA